MGAGLAAASVLVSCNAKDDGETVSDGYVTTESVAITNFSLSADARVMRNLDSVFFSIDLEHGVVFNADSLPKGTKITRLIPKISYPSTVTSAVIEMKGGTNREGTSNYYTNANDTIDFSGTVTLTLGTKNDAVKKTYTLKVNVHEEDPDTIYWNREAFMPFPSRLPDPKEQKTVASGTGVTSLIVEKDGSFTLASSADVFAGDWAKEQISLPFSPLTDTFTADGEGGFYLLSDTGDLMQSADGRSWSKIASGWENIIGMYGDALLGFSGSRMLCWPLGAVELTNLPSGFPVSGFSNTIEFENRWSSESTLILFGGVTADGTLSSASWAFDGSEWADIASKPLPALEGVSVVNYYSYLNSTSNGHLREFEAYLAFGGRDSNGNLNTATFVTYDHGISWQRARDYMQMPAEVSSGFKVDALTIGTSMSSNLSDRWKSHRRVSFEIDGDLLIWECPYIFLFGGYDANMKLNPEVRSGVLQRLTFAPLF